MNLQETETKVKRLLEMELERLERLSTDITSLICWTMGTIPDKSGCRCPACVVVGISEHPCMADDSLVFGTIRVDGVEIPICEDCFDGSPISFTFTERIDD